MENSQKNLILFAFCIYQAKKQVKKLNGNYKPSDFSITCFSSAAFPTSLVDDVSISFKPCKLQKRVLSECWECSSMAQPLPSMHKALGSMFKSHTHKHTRPHTQTHTVKTGRGKGWVTDSHQ